MRLQDAVFSPLAARQAIRRTLRKALEQQKCYDPSACSRLAKSLVEEVKQAVIAATPCTRYKLIVQVQVGERCGQAVTQGSRCLWDAVNDACVAETAVSDGVVCCCQLHALYYE